MDTGAHLRIEPPPRLHRLGQDRDAVGIVSDRAVAGAARIRWAAPSGNAAAKPRITPIGSLSRSQRETWATSGVPAPGRKPSVFTSQRRSTRAVPPTARSNTASAPLPRSSASRPVLPRIAFTWVGVISWFFGERPSIEGGTIAIGTPLRRQTSGT